jgi:hypothetical protein
LVWLTIGKNPDFAYLNSPACVLCAYPNRRFRDAIAATRPRIYDNSVSDEHELYDPKNHDYIEVVLNWDLKPNTSGHNEERGADKVDWLYVLKDGMEPPDNSRRIGGASGYTIYTYPRVPESGKAEDSGDYHFFEFVLAILETTAQSAEIQKTTAPAPQITQPFPTR